MFSTCLCSRSTKKDHCVSTDMDSRLRPFTLCISPRTHSYMWTKRSSCALLCMCKRFLACVPVRQRYFPMKTKRLKKALIVGFCTCFLFALACELFPNGSLSLDIGGYTIGLRPWVSERKPIFFRETVWASYSDGSCRELRISQFVWFTTAKEVPTAP